MANWDSLFRSRDIALPTKIPWVKAVFFSCSHVWVWELDRKGGWAFRIDAFELWYWRRLLRVPWTTRRSNQSILKEINPEYSLEALMLKLKLQYLGHLMWRTDSLEKTLMLGKIEGRRRGDNRRWNGWMASLTWWTWVWACCGSWWWTVKPGLLQSMGSQRVGYDCMTELNCLTISSVSSTFMYKF